VRKRSFKAFQILSAVAVTRLQILFANIGCRPVAALVVLVVAASGSLPANAASVTLTWNPDSTPALAGYRLHYGTASRSYASHLAVGANATSATVSNLQNGRTYFFSVTAKNTAGLESAYSAEVSYSVPATPPPLVSVIAGTNASEPRNLGSFLFTRTGDVSKALTVYFTLDGDAQSGVDYKNPGSKLVFRPGRTNATLWIRPIADRIFEGAKTLELALVDAPNLDMAEQDSASILVGDDDRPRIVISASRNPSTATLQTTVHAAAYAGFSLLLQSSIDLTNWTVVAAPLPEQPVDYIDPDSASAQTRFYRAIYVRGEVTEASIAEALAFQLFSANIVGSVNVALQPGWNLAANPLNGATTNGPLGALPDSTLFVPFKSSKRNTYSAGRWSRGVPLTRSTMGGWLYNPSNAPVNISYVGEVPGVASKPTIPAGWSVRSSAVDVTVGDDLLLGYPLHAGDAVYEFNPLGTGADVWITHLRGTNGWDFTPILTAGQGVMIYKTKSTRATVVVAPTPPAPNLIRFVPVAGN
jgi:hypothetical protein